MHPNEEQALLTAAAENPAEQEKKKCSPKQINKTCTKRICMRREILYCLDICSCQGDRV